MADGRANDIDPALVGVVERVSPGYAHADAGSTVSTSGQPDRLRLKRGPPLAR